MSRIVRKILDLFRQGITPSELALAVTIGLALGTVPVLGSTTLLCTLAAAALRLNLPAIQLVNAVTYPLQLALLIPFLQLGSRIFGVEFDWGFEQVATLVATEPWRAIQELWIATMHGLVAWASVSALLAYPMYRLLLSLLQRLHLRAQ